MHKKAQQYEDDFGKSNYDSLDDVPIGSLQDIAVDMVLDNNDVKNYFENNEYLIYEFAREYSDIICDELKNIVYDNSLDVFITHLI